MLSDKSARKEFGLTQEEMIQAIQAGEFQYRTNYMHGNPYFRLICSEVEALVNEKYGENYLEDKKLKHELAQINSELRKLKNKLKKLENRKAEILTMIEK